MNATRMSAYEARSRTDLANEQFVNVKSDILKRAESGGSWLLRKTSNDTLAKLRVDGFRCYRLFGVTLIRW